MARKATAETFLKKMNLASEFEAAPAKIENSGKSCKAGEN